MYVLCVNVHFLMRTFKFSRFISHVFHISKGIF